MARGLGSDWGPRTAARASMSGLPPTAANLSKRVQLFAIAPPRAAFWISTSSMEASLLGEMSSISIRTYRGYKLDCVGIRRVSGGG